MVLLINYSFFLKTISSHLKRKKTPNEIITGIFGVKLRTSLPY